MARYLLFFAIAFALSTLTQAAPSPVSRRQTSTTPAAAPFSGPSQVTTHNVIAVPGGTITEDCQITLDPIVVNGANFVKETRTCMDRFTAGGTVDSTGGSGNGSNNSTGGLSTVDSSSTTTADTSSTTSTDSLSSTDTSSSTTTADGSSSTDTTGGTTSSDTLSSATTDTSSSTTTDPLATTSTDTAGTATTTDAGAASTSLGAQPTDGTTGGATAGNNDGAAQVIGATSIAAGDALPPSASSDSSPTATRANDQAASTTPGLPGKKLEVLPIGLGVFAGISVIALIVVGLVTYERTKYRKAFRQRRLAASGAEMGYGGVNPR